jgi:uncharacterized protein
MSHPHHPSIMLTYIPYGYIYYTMKFEFDPKKSDTNKAKHDIDFIEAQELWNDIDYLEIPAKTTDESRFLVIGKIGEKHWTGIITYRNENIRIISMRRARNEEIELYES